MCHRLKLALKLVLCRLLRLRLWTSSSNTFWSDPRVGRSVVSQVVLLRETGCALLSGCPVYKVIIGINGCIAETGTCQRVFGEGCFSGTSFCRFRIVPKCTSRYLYLLAVSFSYMDADTNQCCTVRHPPMTKLVALKSPSTEAPCGGCPGCVRSSQIPARGKALEDLASP